MSGVLVVFGVALGVALILAARARLRRIRPIPEAVPSCSVAELEAGRFRVTGRVVPQKTAPSRIDGAPCVFREHAEYRTVGSELVPLLREVEHVTVAYPFFLDDGTGRLLIDPDSVVVEAVTLFEDAGLTAERRLRAGEEIELVATFEVACPEGGPYRAGFRSFAPVEDACGPPRITYRTQPGMLVPGDDLAVFLRSAGALTLVATALFGVLSLL